MSRPNEPSQLRVARAAGTSRSAARILAEAGPTVSVREAATVLGCCAATVRAMNARGDLAELGIRVLRLGTSIRITTASLRKAVDADRLTPGGDAA